MEIEYPTLSLRERDRRWGLCRELMKSVGLDCLMVAGLNGMEQLDGYITNDFMHGMVFFSQDEEPTFLTWSASYITRHMEDIRRGGTGWLSDIRVGANASDWVSILKEKGFDSATIGVVGLESGVPGAPEGYIPYKSWAYVLEHLPGVTFIEVTPAFAELMMVNSEEEQKLIRHAALIGEMACEAMLEITRPGVTEGEIYATILSVNYSHGATAISPYLILQSGVDNPSWQEPIWTYKARRPRTIEKGDLVQAELFQRYGGKDAQQQMSIALKTLHPVNQELADLARRSYEIGLKALRPGRRFEDVVKEMEVPILEAGGWYLTPLLHTFNPLMGAAGRTQVGIEQVPGILEYKGIQGRKTRGADVVLKPGTTFSMQPNACRGRHRVNIGGTVMLTESGVEELNKLPTFMQVIDL